MVISCADAWLIWNHKSIGSPFSKMTSITPFLWFDNNVPQAVRLLYKSVFPNAKVENVNDFMATFELEGQRFNALNGGPKYKFNEAVSFFISVETKIIRRTRRTRPPETD